MPIELPPPIKIEIQRSRSENLFLISDASRKAKEPKLKQFPYVPPLDSKPNLPKYDPPLKGLVHFSKLPVAFPEIESMRIPNGWTEEYVRQGGAPGPKIHWFKRKGDGWYGLILDYRGLEPANDLTKELNDLFAAPPHEIKDQELKFLQERRVAVRGLPDSAKLKFARTVDWNGKRVIESQGIEDDGNHFYGITYATTRLGNAPIADTTIKFEAKEAIFLKYLPAMKKSMRSIKWTDSMDKKESSNAQQETKIPAALKKLPPERRMTFNSINFGPKFKAWCEERSKLYPGILLRRDDIPPMRPYKIKSGNDTEWAWDLVEQNNKTDDSEDYQKEN